MNYILTLLLFFVSNASVCKLTYASSSYSRLVNSGLQPPHHHAPTGEQPLAKIAIHKTVLALHKSAYIRANPFLLGLKGEDAEWINVNFEYPNPSNDDWVGVFSPAKFNASDCYAETGNWPEVPYLCTAPIKYKLANHSTSNYAKTGKATLSFRIINQHADFSFALFTGGLENPKLVAVSDPISFANPKAPLYPRLAHGKAWDEMTVTWTSGYNIDEAIPLVEWGWKGQTKKLSPAHYNIRGFPHRNFGCFPGDKSMGKVFPIDLSMGILRRAKFEGDRFPIDNPRQRVGPTPFSFGNKSDTLANFSPATRRWG